MTMPGKEKTPAEKWRAKVNNLMANKPLMKKYARWMEIRSGKPEKHKGERDTLEQELVKHL